MMMLESGIIGEFTTSNLEANGQRFERVSVNVPLKAAWEHWPILWNKMCHPLNPRGSLFSVFADLLVITASISNSSLVSIICLNYMIHLVYMSIISEETYRNLYHLAAEFRQLAPWRWMYETDLFGIKSPTIGQIGYCSIMGREGDSMGMAIYRGGNGLASYERLQKVNQDGPMLPPNPAFEQDCLMVTFGSREDLPSEMVDLIEGLGITIEGESHWPNFTDYSPGLFPWPIDLESQAGLLLEVMRQAMEVAHRCKSDQDLLDHVEGAAPCLLVREFKNDTWVDHWSPVSAENSPVPPTIETHSLFLRSNLIGIVKIGVTWAFDIFYFPNPVQDDPRNRPYLPLMLILADLESGYVVGTRSYAPGEVGKKLEKDFAEIGKEAGYIPQRLIAASRDARSYFSEISKELKLKLEVDSELRLISDIKLSLFDSMSL